MNGVSGSDGAMIADMAKACASRMASTSVLLVDDDRELCCMLGEYLSPEGFGVSVVHDGERALYALGHYRYDVVVLDVMLPSVSGLEVLRRMRRNQWTPVLMLTARGEEADRVAGLELGADDYLPKPFNPRELVARLRAIVRRCANIDRQSGQRERLDAGPVSLVYPGRLLEVKGQQVALTSAEFRLLEMLMLQVGSVNSREQLSRQVLGRSYAPDDRSIDTHVSNIRRKLVSVAKGVSILNVRCSGYVLTVSDASEAVI